MVNVVLDLPPAGYRLQKMGGLSHAEFERICFDNPELQVELTPDGTIVFKSPVSPYSGNNEAQLISELTHYARKHGGRSFSSSTGFTLPDGSVRSPDACYVSEAQFALFSKEDLKHFAALVPEFIVELLSPSDSLAETQRKMQNTWIANGVQLAWLVDTENEKLYVYRANGTVDLITPLGQSVSGEDVLPGFTFDLRLLS